jgi:hypothetical protein
VKLPSADITRQAIGLAGLTFALAGVISGYRAVVWLAMVFLAISVAIRVTLQIRRRRSE